MQPAHGVADRLAHALHLVLATLVDRQLDVAGTEAARAGRRRAALGEVDAVLEPLELGGSRVALDLGDVDLVDLVTRVRQVVRELTGLGLKEAKDLVDGAPKPVKEKVTKAEADDMMKKLQEQGATVQVK